nr:hypothetical protein Iba_chr10cCG9860 [Ipomoea batatas]
MLPPWCSAFKHRLVSTTSLCSQRREEESTAGPSSPAELARRCSASTITAELHCCCCHAMLPKAITIDEEVNEAVAERRREAGKGDPLLSTVAVATAVLPSETKATALLLPWRLSRNAAGKMHDAIVAPCSVECREGERRPERRPPPQLAVTTAAPPPYRRCSAPSLSLLSPSVVRSSSRRRCSPAPRVGVAARRSQSQSSERRTCTLSRSPFLAAWTKQTGSMATFLDLRRPNDGTEQPQNFGVSGGRTGQRRRSSTPAANGGGELPAAERLGGEPSSRAGAAGEDGDGIAIGLSEGGASLEIEIFRDRVGEE